MRRLLLSGLLLTLALAGCPKEQGGAATASGEAANRANGANGEASGANGAAASQPVQSDADPAALLAARVLDLEYNAVALGELAPQPMAVFYYSATCPHCQTVAPEVEQLASRLAEHGWSLVAVASSSNSLAQLRQFAEAYGWTIPSVHDVTGAVRAAGRFTSTPNLLLVDEAGAITLDLRPYGHGSGLLAEGRILELKGEDPLSAFEPGVYYGSRTCGSCHELALESWYLTHHSVALAPIARGDRLDDPECVRCHVVGHGEPGGFVDLESTAHLAHVGCEACHGPGGPHGTAANAALPEDERLALTPPNSFDCTACHDEKHSIQFDLGRALPFIDHRAAEGMTPAQVAARAQSLFEGTAERPLLAFPEGDNQGSAACLSCHPNEVAHWQSTPHAHAWQRLVDTGTEDRAECRECHELTLPDGGTEPGVSCEHCHGPGEQHIAEGGGTHNILGMGEECPECIIEGICLTCHDPTNDPGWELAGHFSRVRHSPAEENAEETGDPSAPATP